MARIHVADDFSVCHILGILFESLSFPSVHNLLHVPPAHFPLNKPMLQAVFHNFLKVMRGERKVWNAVVTDS